MLGSFFSRLFPASRRKVHLRHILYLGSLIERQAEAFYREMANKAPHEEVKELCLKLAADEKRHFQLIDGILSRWKSLSLTPDDLKALEAKEKMQRIFQSRLDSNAGNKEIIEYAMNEEKKMVSFYESYENEFTSLWKLAKLQEMIEEERGHVAKLTDMLSQV